MIVCFKIIHSYHNKNGKLERAVDDPHAKVIDPLAPQVPLRGHDPGNRMKIPFNMFAIIYLSTHTKFGIKIFEIDFVTEIKWDLIFWLHPKVTSLTPGWKLYNVLAFCSARQYATWIYMFYIFHLWFSQMKGIKHEGLNGVPLKSIKFGPKNC